MLCIVMLITFRVSRIDDAKCIVVTHFCVCLSVCPLPHAHATALTRM